jgi:parallel beta-helix repeat protein
LRPAPDNTIIRNNKIHDNGAPRGYGGITLHTGANCQVYNNVIYNNVRGIDSGDTAANALIYSNTFYGNQNFAIDITGVSGWIVRDNLFYNNSSNFGSTGGATISNNMCSTSPCP